jgi:diaminohydroxyphosphoribosylaminopyrimidine deaminase/5-amino-6-(5-phosphoribosylamino)uracil reductase
MPGTQSATSADLNTLFIPAGEEFTIKSLQSLFAAGIKSILIEGGAATLKKFIQAGLFHEAIVFTAPTIFGSGKAAPEVNHTLPIASYSVGPDTLSVYASPLYTALFAGSL